VVDPRRASSVVAPESMAEGNTIRLGATIIDVRSWVKNTVHVNPTIGGQHQVDATIPDGTMTRPGSANDTVGETADCLVEVTNTDHTSQLRVSSPTLHDTPQTMGFTREEGASRDRCSARQGVTSCWTGVKTRELIRANDTDDTSVRGGAELEVNCNSTTRWVSEDFATTEDPMVKDNGTGSAGGTRLSCNHNTGGESGVNTRVMDTRVRDDHDVDATVSHVIRDVGGDGDETANGRSPAVPTTDVKNAVSREERGGRW
jgi:hypothetical protein